MMKFQTHQRAGVGRVRRILLQEARQAEVGHLAHQVAVDQDVAGGQVPVDVTHLCQVLHARGDATQHTNELDHSKLTIVLLEIQIKYCLTYHTQLPPGINKVFLILILHGVVHEGEMLLGILGCL